MSVFAPCWGRLLQDGESKWRNRFILPLIRNSHLSVKWRFIFEKQNKKRQKKSRSADLMLDSWACLSRFPQIYFCTCTFEYYQLQSKVSTQDLVKCRRKTKSVTLHQGSAVERQATVLVASHSFPPPTDTHINLLFIQSEMYRKTWNLSSSSTEVHSWRCRFSQHACAYTEDDGDEVSSAFRRWPQISIALVSKALSRSSVYAPVDTCQSVYVNVQLLFYLICLFVRLFEFCKQKGAQLNWSAIDICSSSSSERLYLSVLAQARPTASRTLFTLHHF